jgi:hypothetical protein
MPVLVDVVCSDVGGKCESKTCLDHRNLSINRKGTYILVDIHGMDHLCPKLAPQPI